MARHVHDITAGDLANLIDAICELIAAIFDVDAGFGVRDVPAVYIGDAGHCLHSYSNVPKTMRIGD